MAQFTYKARRRTGEVVEGILDVADRGAAAMQIEKLGLLPVAITAAKGSALAKVEQANRTKETRAALLPPALREVFTRQRKPKLQELATYTQQLANLLKSGMPLTVALNSMTHLASKGISSEVSKQLKQDVMEGRSLSDAMAKQPVVFSDLYINMVRAGEQSGALVEVLQRLAVHFERFAEVQAKFVSAMIYPAVVASVGIVIMFFFMTVMLPKFMSIFQGLNVPLPVSTQMLVGAGDFFKTYWWLLMMVLLCLIMLFKRYQTSDRGRRTIDHWKMNAPVIRRVMRLNLFGQFARTLSTLLHNGVPVLTALKITEQIMPNRILKEAIAKTREEVTDGKTIAQPLARSKIFPQLMIDLLKIGEETGDVPGALENVANTYENELTIALRVMTNLIEPAMIIVMALGVGFLVVQRFVSDVRDYFDHWTMTIAPTTRRGFTLIEVMIVVGIMAMIMTAGVPMMWKAMTKNELSKAVSDTIEGCKTARDRAILQNRPYDFVIRNRTEKDAEITVEQSKIRDPAGLAFPGSAATTVREPGSLMGDFPRKVGQDVAVELIAVNFVDHMGASEARVRFYQNGTSDEFTVVFAKDGKQREVKVDIITGTAFEVMK